MKVGDKVWLCSHDRPEIRELEIVEENVPSGINDKLCYKTNEGSLFYVRNAVYTGRHYNVGNNAFWIITK